MGVNLHRVRGRSLAWLDRNLRGLAVASLVVNVLIVVTGGVVRLTDSGLGCPTWPRCTDDAFTPHGAMTLHSAIEFGNRMVTFLIAAVAVLTFVAAWRSGRTALRRPALVLALGVPAQAVVGGVTVLTDLNPWIVAFHLLVSMAMICVAVVLVRRVGEPDTDPVPTTPDGVRWLTWAVFWCGWAVLYLGTVVTGSGPHAGDVDAPRNGLDPRAVSQLHTDLVFLLLGLTVATVLVLRSAEAPRRLRDAATLLLVVELAQGVVGFAQYFTGLPVVLVGLHLLGAALTAAALTWLVLGTRDRLPAVDPVERSVAVSG
ncbi:MAG TPA: COX15/CtaA family protein [Marmoricola sp.]|nr:COX15/CtaA family protein [Marmoricola sp.]